MYTQYALHCRRSIRTIDSAAMSFRARKRKKERKKRRGYWSSVTQRCDPLPFLFPLFHEFLSFYQM